MSKDVGVHFEFKVAQIVPILHRMLHFYLVLVVTNQSEIMLPICSQSTAKAMCRDPECVWGATGDYVCPKAPQPSGVESFVEGEPDLWSERYNRHVEAIKPFTSQFTKDHNIYVKKN